MNHGGTPDASSAPIMLPAEVPTTYSALAGSQPVSRAIASSPPVSQAPPMTPPAPRTRPTLGPLLLTRRSVRARLWLRQPESLCVVGGLVVFRRVVAGRALV